MPTLWVKTRDSVWETSPAYYLQQRAISPYRASGSSFRYARLIALARYRIVNVSD
ncbi:MAG: hypothetical protein OWU33_00625 [Firmicutes bacterium]|nr:hypothetical protein [Bacillota bacterium]